MINGLDPGIFVEEFGGNGGDMEIFKGVNDDRIELMVPSF
jgi:hypothetical protein